MVDRLEEAGSKRVDQEYAKLRGLAHPMLLHLHNLHREVAALNKQLEYHKSESLQRLITQKTKETESIQGFISKATANIIENGMESDIGVATTVLNLIG